ncbi:hypothetical protein [Candidatus Leptofilum sp.]|uniref:hypothetical protein n=1 Tax=Candidatus Leptofilum sp. TaxID=3241576 RepID=UPI003B5C414C
MKKFWLSLLYLIIFVACSSPDSQTSKTNHDETFFLISLPKESWEPHFPDLAGDVNIFQTNLDGSILQPIVTGFSGYNYVMDLSPNGDKFLFASFEDPPNTNPEIVGNLLVFDLETSNFVKLSETYPLNYALVSDSALWLSNDEIAYISNSDRGRLIHTIQADGNGDQSWPALNQIEHLPPLFLHAFQENKVLYWQNGQFDEEGVAISMFPISAEFDDDNFTNPIRLQTLDNSTLIWAVAPTGNLIAWGKEIVTSKIELVARLDLEFEPKTFFWSPNGDRLLIHTCADKGCSGLTKYYLWQQNPDLSSQRTINSFGNLQELPINFNVRWAIWSPSQAEILLLIEEGVEAKNYSLQMLNLSTLQRRSVLEGIEIEPAVLPIYVHSIQWLDTEVDN